MTLVSNDKSGSRPNITFTTFLDEACKDGDIDGVNLALLNADLPSAHTLTLAFKSKKIEVIDRVAKENAKPDEDTFNTACLTNDLAIVNKALVMGLKPDEKTFQLLNTITNTDVIALLEAHRPKPTQNISRIKALDRIEDGPDNALSRACVMGNLAFVQKAIANGVPPQKFTLFKAVQTGNVDIINAVIDAGARPHGDPNEVSELTIAINGFLNEDYEMTFSKAVFEALCRVEGLKPDSATLTYVFNSKYITAYVGASTLLEEVLKLGAKPDENTLNAIIMSLPHIDCAYSLDTIKVALAAGAKPSSNTLDMAIEHFFLSRGLGGSVVELLIKSGAKPSASTLTLACRQNYLYTYKAYKDLIHTLLEAGAKPDADTFSAIAWIKEPNYDYPFSDILSLLNEDSIDNTTLMALLKSGLRPTQAELDNLRNKIGKVTFEENPHGGKIICHKSVKRSYYYSLVENIENSMRGDSTSAYPGQIPTPALTSDSSTISSSYSSFFLNENLQIKRTLSETFVIPSLEDGPDNELTAACVKGNVVAVTNAIANKVPPQKFTLLRAVETSNFDIVKAVIEAGARPHGDPGTTSELSACLKNGKSAVRPNRKICKLLCSSVEGLKPDKETFTYAVPGSYPILNLVSKRGAKPDENTLTACESFDESVARALSAGALPNNQVLDRAIEKIKTENYYEKSFHWDTLKRRARWSVNMLIQAGAKPSKQTLTLACKKDLSPSDYNYLLDLVLSAGATPDADTFSSIQWMKVDEENNNWYFLRDSTIDALFKRGLKPKAMELLKFRKKLYDITPMKDPEGKTTIFKNSRDAFIQKIVNKASDSVGSSSSSSSSSGKNKDCVIS